MIILGTTYVSTNIFVLEGANEYLGGESEEVLPVGWGSKGAGGIGVIGAGISRVGGYEEGVGEKVEGLEGLLESV